MKIAAIGILIYLVGCITGFNALRLFKKKAGILRVDKRDPDVDIFRFEFTTDPRNLKAGNAIIEIDTHAQLPRMSQEKHDL